MDPRARNLAKAALRIILSAAALYVVFKQVDGQLLWHILKTTNPGWLLLGSGLYALSKVFSAFRLTHYFRAHGILLSESQNLRLYWVGMFYNLFLPGGVGGDAYKVWILHRDHKAPPGQAFRAVLLDRLSGLSMLAFLALLSAWISFPAFPWRSALPIAAVMVLGGMAVMHYLMGKSLFSVLPHTTGYALAVQLIQLFCAWTLLNALGSTDQTGAYLTVFLLSSSVAVLPISIGGVGVRELVFIAASTYAPVERETAVAFSLLFFLVTVFNSLPGALVSMPRGGSPGHTSGATNH